MFHADPARGQLAKELKELIAPEHPFLDLFKVFVEACNMKDTFCQIQTDGDNIHLGLLSLLVDGKLLPLHHGALTPIGVAGGDHLIRFRIPF